MNQRASVVGIGLGQRLIVLERGFELAVIEQSLPQCIHGGHIAGLQICRALVGGNGILGSLQLVVGRAEGKFHAGRAIGLGNGFNHLGGVVQVVGFGVDRARFSTTSSDSGLNVPEPS